MCVITAPDLTKSLHWKWQVSAVLVLSAILKGECSVPEHGAFNPKNGPDDQPMTFLPPIPYNECSLYKPGTSWHFINSYSGRCCFQTFVTNGTFRICDVNGGHDQQAECPNGFYNWKTPFYSGRFQFSGQAKDLCTDTEPVDGVAIPNITWNYEEFIRRERTSVILQGNVYSTSDLVEAYLFKNDETLPLGKMESRKLAVTDGVYMYQVRYKLTKLTHGDDGLYSILATNKRTIAWSIKARLRVLYSESTTKISTESQTKAAVDFENTTLDERQTKPLTSVSTSTNPTEKPVGIGTVEYIILGCVPAIIGSLLACVFWKCGKCRTKAITDHNEEQNNEKSDVEEELL